MALFITKPVLLPQDFFNDITFKSNRFLIFVPYTGIAAYESLQLFTLKIGGKSMEDYEDATSGKLVRPPAQHRRWRSLLLVSGLALAFMLALGIGVFLG